MLRGFSSLVPCLQYFYSQMISKFQLCYSHSHDITHKCLLSSGLYFPMQGTASGPPRPILMHTNQKRKERERERKKKTYKIGQWDRVRCIRSMRHEQHSASRKKKRFTFSFLCIACYSIVCCSLFDLVAGVWLIEWTYVEI